MSGHSKWATIKHKKGLKDAKRGALFTKLARDITLAASEGGGDIDMNFALRLSVEKAKQANMPKENIDRAVKKGTGQLEGNTLTRVSYEAYGPQGTAFVIDCTTDNTNRTVAEIKNIVEGMNAKMAQLGSVLWQFEDKGLIQLKAEKIKKALKYGQEDTFESVEVDELMLELMELEGVEDIVQEDDTLEIKCKREDLKKVYDKIKDLGLNIISSEIVKIAKDEVSIDESTKTKVVAIIDALEEHDDVDDVWVNVA